MANNAKSRGSTALARGSLAAFALIVGVFLVTHYRVYIFNPPPIHDLTIEQRRAVMLSALKLGQGVMALTEAGMSVLQRPDVAVVGRSRCTGERECTQYRKDGRRALVSTCVELSVNLFCAFETSTKTGDPAAVLIKTGIGRTWPSLPDLSAQSPDFLYEIVSTERPSETNAREKLCQMGYCGTSDLLRWKRAKTIAPIDPNAQARADCIGVLADVRGKGQVCLDPGNPDSRDFRDCASSFCGPLMVALPRGRGVRGVSDAELAKLKIDFPDFSGLGKDEHPERHIDIGYDLAVGKFEVTVEAWARCVADRQCKAGADATATEDGRKPFNAVSWIDITRDYLPWLNRKLGLNGADAYRLLSDGEWEYAARAGTTSRYAFGDRLDAADANFHSGHFTSPRGTLLPVGARRPNAFGLHDIHGNVAEWVQDCLTFASDTDKLPLDGSARTLTVFGKECSPSDHRIVRGGSFASGAEGVRSATRALLSADRRSDQIGFRLARTLYRPKSIEQSPVVAKPTFLVP